MTLHAQHSKLGTLMINFPGVSGFPFSMFFVLHRGKSMVDLTTAIYCSTIDSTKFMNTLWTLQKMNR